MNQLREACNKKKVKLMKKVVKNEIQVWPFLIQNSQSVFRFQREQ